MFMLGGLRRRASGGALTAPRWIAARALIPVVTVATVTAGGLSTSRADDPLRFEFRGTIEPMQTVTIASHLNGIVDAVLFTPGQTVSAGDPLFRIDPKEFEIFAAAARAHVKEAGAHLEFAAAAAERQARLLDSGSGSGVRAFEAEIERRVAEARLRAAEADLAAAELALERTEINAPIDGKIGWPLVAPGAFIGAEPGTALAKIVRTDPVLVAYAVSPETRAAALAKSGGESVAAMFERMTVEIVLPAGEIHEHPGRPRFDSAEIDPHSKMLTSWAEVPNPDGTLLPGLSVTVISRLGLGER